MPKHTINWIHKLFINILPRQAIQFSKFSQSTIVYIIITGRTLHKGHHIPMKTKPNNRINISRLRNPFLNIFYAHNVCQEVKWREQTITANLSMNELGLIQARLEIERPIGNIIFTHHALLKE